MVIRRIRGTVVMPPVVSVATAMMVLDLRDTSLADAPAPVIAVSSFPNTEVAPGRHHPFEMEAPEAPLHHHLSLRCHIDLTGDGTVTTGDLLSTESIHVASTGDVSALTVPVLTV